MSCCSEEMHPRSRELVSMLGGPQSTIEETPGGLVTMVILHVYPRTLNSA